MRTALLLLSVSLVSMGGAIWVTIDLVSLIVETLL